MIIYRTECKREHSFKKILLSSWFSFFKKDSTQSPRTTLFYSKNVFSQENNFMMSILTFREALDDRKEVSEPNDKVSYVPN